MLFLTNQIQFVEMSSNCRFVRQIEFIFKLKISVVVQYFLNNFEWNIMSKTLDAALCM